jgi:hypothetical protein
MDYDAVVRAAMNARREAMRAEAAQPIALRAPYAGYAASPTGYFSPEMAMLPNPPPMYSPRMGEGYTMEYERRSMPPSPPSGFVYAGYPAFPAAVASGRGVLPYSPGELSDAYQLPCSHLFKCSAVRNERPDIACSAAACN